MLYSLEIAFKVDYFRQYHWLVQINYFTVGCDFERSGGSKTNWFIGYRFSTSQESMLKQRKYGVLYFSFNLAKLLLLDIVIVLIKIYTIIKSLTRKSLLLIQKCYYVQSQNMFKKLGPVDH